MQYPDSYWPYPKNTFQSTADPPLPNSHSWRNQPMQSRTAKQVGVGVILASLMTLFTGCLSASGRSLLVMLASQVKFDKVTTEYKASW